jgi:hypothetical protein
MQTVQGFSDLSKSQFDAESLRYRRNTTALERMHRVLNRWDEELGCLYVIQEAGPFVRHEDLHYEMGFHLTVRAVTPEAARHLNAVLTEVAEQFPDPVRYRVQPTFGGESIRTLTVTTERAARH